MRTFAAISLRPIWLSKAISLIHTWLALLSLNILIARLHVFPHFIFHCCVCVVVVVVVFLFSFVLVRAAYGGTGLKVRCEYGTKVNT